jgi:hypothetical protein
MVDGGTRETTTPGHRLRRAVLALTAATCGFAVLASSAGAASFAWSGASPVDTTSWSNGTNWAGTAPSGSVETLTFPALTSGACTAKPPTATCYTSNNDVTGLNANAISIDDGVKYSLTGNAITLGGGGITASTPGSATGAAYFGMPITLNAPQTWLIDGSNSGGQVGFSGHVTGGSNALAINLTQSGSINLPGTIEAGPVTINGYGSNPGSVALFGSGSLNGSNGQPVAVSSGVEIVFGADNGTPSIGPLTMTGGGGTIGTFVGGLGVLAVNGGVTLNSISAFKPSITKAGTIAGADYTQLSASGTVNLASAHFSLQSSIFPQGGGQLSCSTLTPGDVDTLLTTTGSLTGTFASVPDGTTVTASCEGGSGTPATVRINYTAHTVTATVLTSGGSGTTTTTTLSASPSSPVTNQTVTLTATVTASPGTPSGTVSFENHGTPIASCESKPVVLVGSSYTATCQTTFTAASSPDALTAVFTPAGGSGLQGSTSSTDNLTVGQNSEELTRKQHEEEEAVAAAAAKKHQEEAAAAAAKKHQEEEAAAAAAAAAKKHQEEEAAAKKKQEEEKAKSKPPTRAQLLAKALKTCKKQPKKKRAKCEATAKKKYGPKKKATKKKKKK